MRVVVTADGADLDAPASPVFGRCPTYVFVDTETMAFEALENPAISAPAGAGIQAAQFVVEHKAQAVVTGNTGPNAFDVLQSANVPVYLFAGGTVREAVQAYQAGQLSAAGGASAKAHSGMGAMRTGSGMGRRAGGRGMGMGRGVVVPATQPAHSATASGSREEEIVALKEMTVELRRQSAQVLERLGHLEEGE